jgi:hypothetical protein
MNSRARIIVVLVVMAAVAILTLSGSLPTPWRSDNDLNVMVTAQDLQSSEATFTNCRYGVTPVSSDDVNAVTQIGAGWYLNFQPYPYGAKPANNAEFAHIIHVKQNIGTTGYLPSWYTIPPLNNELANYIKSKPGSKYLLGNEIDRKGQGEIHPDLYALAYHDVYNFIKKADPTAQIAISGLVEVTPMRTQYLDIVWDTYMRTYGTAIPVDIWNMHLYPLPEVVLQDGELKPSRAGVALGTDINLGIRESDLTPNQCGDPYDNIYCYAEHDDMDVFAEQIIRMRQWMKDHGQQDKPLIISEYSVLWPYIVDSQGCYLMDEFGKCFVPDRISKFMVESFNYLNQTKSTDLGYPADDYRLVQQWMWFATYRNPGDNGNSSNLLESDHKTLTQVGRTFRDYVANEPVYRNLVVDRVDNVAVQAQPDNNATARISVLLRNNGNADVQQPFNVTFYSNSGLTAKIGTVRINPLVKGCATTSYKAAVDWTGLSKGAHQFWVVVDSEGEIQESPTGNVDNTGQGTVIVRSDYAAMPVVASD